MPVNLLWAFISPYGTGNKCYNKHRRRKRNKCKTVVKRILLDVVVYLIGKEGVASTALRPAGKCNIDGVEFDVRSDGRYIAKGSRIQIIRVQGNTLIIKEK